MNGICLDQKDEELQTLRTHVSDVNGVSLTQALALAFSVRNEGKCC